MTLISVSLISCDDNTNLSSSSDDDDGSTKFCKVSNGTYNYCSEISSSLDCEEDATESETECGDEDLIGICDIDLTEQYPDEDPPPKETYYFYPIDFEVIEIPFSCAIGELVCVEFTEALTDLEDIADWTCVNDLD